MYQKRIDKNRRRRSNRMSLAHSDPPKGCRPTVGATGGVFINYRGADSHSYGALLYTELARQFGAEQVFLDCESIPAGADFTELILARARSARVLLAVIGPHWLTATDPTQSSHRRRIDDPADWIRRELSAAFAAGVRVIPVLTEHAQMPTEADLPADLAALSRCQYRRLRYDEPATDLARIGTDLTNFDPTLAAAARRRADASCACWLRPGYRSRASRASVSLLMITTVTVFSLVLFVLPRHVLDPVTTGIPQSDGRIVLHVTP